MKILVTLHDIDNLDKLLKVSDGIMLGQKLYSKTLTKDFSDQTIDIIQQIFKQGKEVFILLNRIYTDEELEHVHTYLKTLPADIITGFIGADIGLLDVFKKLDLLHKFVYNPETLLTNDIDFNDLFSEGIKGAFVSKEITLEDILEISQYKKYELFYFGHGHMSMFYSKRAMLQTFNDYKEEPHALHADKTLRLIEAKRLNEGYPVLEDDAGTHVFRGAVFNSFKALEKLKGCVDYFIVDTLFLDDDYALEIIPMYHLNMLDETLLEKYDQTLHDGFLFDESTIKGEIK